MSTPSNQVPNGQEIVMTGSGTLQTDAMMEILPRTSLPSEVRLGRPARIDIFAVNRSDRGNIAVEVLADNTRIHSSGGFLGPSGAWRVHFDYTFVERFQSLTVRVGSPVFTANTIGVDDVHDELSTQVTVSGLAERERQLAIGAAGAVTGGAVAFLLG